MLTPDLQTVRITLHLLAAAVWVGGQLTLAGLVPALRSAGDDVPRIAARAFNRVAWPAYGVLLATGTWNLFEVSLADRSSAYQVTVLVKLLVVAASGIAAAVHGAARSRAALAVGGAISGLTAVLAVLLGALLRG